MIPIVLGIGAAAFVIALIGTGVMIRIGRVTGALDTPPMGGQIKDPARAVPNTGGVAIAGAVWIPMLAGLLVASFLEPGALPSWTGGVREVWPLLRERLPLGWGMLGAVLVIHAIGLYDDRRPLGPWSKLIVMLAAAAIFPLALETRLLTMLDAHVGGSWLSIAITIVWITLVINAMNFIDNTDGLSAGVAAIAGGLFLVAALMNAQWFIGATLALMVGGCLGFLVFNAPPAKIFMGDGGSLVIGLILGVTTVRTTYIPTDGGTVASAWYALIMPIAVLAVPLYDFASVTIIRITRGKSPFVGDLQHFSHRLRDRGLSARATILVIYALTAGSGIAGILLTRANDWEAILLGIQIVCVVGALSIFELRSPRDRGG